MEGGQRTGLFLKTKPARISRMITNSKSHQPGDLCRKVPTLHARTAIQNSVGSGVEIPVADAGKKIIQRISRSHLSDGLKATTNETAKFGIVADRAFMCHLHHFDFGGCLFGRDRQGIHARQEGAWPLTAPV
jgi:hypothetical protein